MNANQRLHNVLLTLWDIARDNPRYDRKLWGELQVCLSQLETRNNLLCGVLADLLHCTDDAGNIMWEAASVNSPPQGFAIKFMREELERESRPTMPKPDPVIPLDELGRASDPTETPYSARVLKTGGLFDQLAETQPLGLTQGKSERPSYSQAKQPPQVDPDEYDGDDESGEEDLLSFEFDFGTTD